MVGQCINKISSFYNIVGITTLVILVQGCSCSLGWGHQTLTNKSYIPLRNWSDSNAYFGNLRKFATEHPELKLTQTEALTYLNKSDSIDTFEELDCPICIDEKPCICIHYWYFIVREKNIVFKLGLYDGGLSIKEVYMKHDSSINFMSRYELCEMEGKSRRQLKREITGCFETDILPKMKPYFEK